MEPGVILGRQAAVRWSYYTAAAIDSYRVRRVSRGHWTLTAHVCTADAYRLRQRPLTFAALLERNRIWLWPVLEFDLTHGQLQARLGAPVE